MYHTNVCMSPVCKNLKLIGTLSGRGIVAHIALFPPARLRVVTPSFEASLTGRRSRGHMCLAETTLFMTYILMFSFLYHTLCALNIFACKYL